MADQPAQSTPTQDGNEPSEPTSGAGGEQKPEPQVITMTTQQLAERLARAKPADYDDLKSKAARLDEIEQSNKSDLQRITEDRDSHRARGDSAELAAARYEVALDKGLTKTQAKRLVGNTREELEADAEELLTDLGRDAGPKPPKPNPAQGQEQGPITGGDWLRDSLARH